MRQGIKVFAAEPVGMRPAKPSRVDPSAELSRAMPEPVPSSAAVFDPNAYIAATAPLLGIAIEAGWTDAITANLRVLAGAAALLTEFPLPDTVEAAPRFEA